MSNRIDGNIGDDAEQAAIGKDIQQVSIYTDRLTWRETVRDEFSLVHRQFSDLRGWVRGLLIGFCVISFLMLIIGLFALRQFDLQALRIENNQDRIERLEQRVIPPVPFTPIP